jgi:hypothetical protein
MHQPADIFPPVLTTLEGAFRQLETKVPQPIRKPWLDGFVFRYTEQTIQQAIIQKLARMISGLHATKTLLEHGLFQEQGMMQRALDEISEDISFLSLGVIYNDITDRHKQFLEYFYAEEFTDASDIIGSHASRGMVKRDKIRAYIGRHVSDPKGAGKIIAKAYSGFIHAASPHIMDMYGGVPPRFDLNGASKDLRGAEFERDAANYFYRAILTMAFAGKALGDEHLFSSMSAFASQIEAQMASA